MHKPEDHGGPVGAIIMGPETPDSIKAVCVFFLKEGEVQLASAIHATWDKLVVRHGEKSNGES